MVVFLKRLVSMVVLFFSFSSLAQDVSSPTAPATAGADNKISSCVLGVTVSGAITAATYDYLARAQEEVSQLGCHGIFLRLNTPGGSLQSTRLIVEKILASKVPYICLISPAGGHAGSAGAILLQACHISGGLTATNLGAATPVMGTGQEMGEDLRKKMINDTVSWMEGVTRLRGRNLEFSKDIITEAKALSTTEAVKIKALDLEATSEAEFLKLLEGRQVQVNESSQVVLGSLKVLEFQPDLRTKALNFFADPEISYILFMGSLGLLYLEITNPGLMVPGILGSMGLVVSLISFHKLEVMWGGVALIFLGILLLIAELFVTSFGVLGIGGIVSLFFGSLLMFSFERVGFSLPLTLIFSVVGSIALVALGLGYFTVKTLFFKSEDGDDVLKKSEGRVLNAHQLEVLGDIWEYQSTETLVEGDLVEILNRDKLTLIVKKK